MLFSKGEQALELHGTGEGMDFAIVLLNKQTIIQRPDKKESQRSAGLRPTVNTAQTVSNWWELHTNY